MKFTKLFILFVCVLLVTSVFAQESIKLKDLYATSTNIPESSNQVSNLFDNDESTVWSTMPGAGPDEGIMLYFDTPVYIAYLKITQPDNEEFAKIIKTRIYVNGKTATRGSIENDPIVELRKEEISSLYIKINQVDGIKSKYFNGLIHYTSNDLPVALSDIQFLNDQMEPIDVLLPNRISATVSATSTLKPILSYGIQNLFDGKKEFGWVEGADNNGEGESMTFNFESEQTLTGIKIRNGYQRSDKHFTANSRLKRATFMGSGALQFNVYVEDSQDEQIIKFPEPITANFITLKIVEAYPGTKYKDLVISQLKFINDDGDILINPNLVENIKTELKSKVENTILSDIVDRRIFNALEDMDGFNRSIVLRSDYSFVVYDYTWLDGQEQNEVIAEGNWQIKELSETKARIRVFGKLTRTSEIIDFYKGNTTKNYQNIFQDYLNIENGAIKGEKFIKTIMLPPNE
ncbi:MAG: discoidin domain-containing protein [bacterium]|nr:discoidin domain-containing protein [bacterium]